MNELERQKLGRVTALLNSDIEIPNCSEISAKIVYRRCDRPMTPGLRTPNADPLCATGHG